MTVEVPDWVIPDPAVTEVTVPTLVVALVLIVTVVPLTEVVIFVPPE